MGEKNVEVNKWLGNKQRFADLFNGCVFGGDNIVKPDDLQRLDRESDFVITDKNKTRKSYQRYRDVIMGWKDGVTLAVLACETQDRIHYGMAARNMLYDAVSYMEQMSKLWEEDKVANNTANEGKNDKGQTDKKAHKKLTQEEYLSRFEKGKRIQPVITLVFYYGDKEWDGSRDLYGMFGWDLSEKRFKMLGKYVQNYKINLIDPREIIDLKKFHTDLQLIFQMLQYKSNRDNMIEFINNNREYFSSVNAETYNAIRVMFGLNKVLEYKENADNKEGYDMCKAFDDYFDEGVQMGVERGLEQGIEKGIEKGESLLAALMSRLFLDNRTDDARLAANDEEVRRRLYKEYGLIDVKGVRA